MGDKMGVLVLAMLIVFQMGIALADTGIVIDIKNDDLEKGERAEISIAIESDIDIIEVEVDYGDGETENFPCKGVGCFIWKDYEYNEGDYRVGVIVTTTNGTFNKTSNEISVNEIEIDDLHPVVSLSNPRNNSLLKTNKVSFRFFANDDFGLNKCTLQIYNALSRELKYSNIFNNLSKEEDILYNLNEFEDGNYTWKVSCEDSAGQTDSDSEMGFAIQTVLHDKEKDIAVLIDILENFLEKKRNLGLKEKEAIDDLGIGSNLDYYKKRLPQIDQDLGTNLKFISDESLREERRTEALTELEEIREDIPIDFEIVDDDKFIKNNIAESLYEITRDYVLAKGLILNDRKIKKLGKANLEIQSRFSATTEIKEIQIKYNDSERNVLLVKKNIEIANEMFNVVLEKLPNGINPVFINKVEDLGDGLYEIDLNELDKPEIVYYIDEDSSIEELKKAESTLFYEFPVDSFGITGYFSFIGDVGENSSYIVIILVILVVLGYIGWKNLWRIQMSGWKKEENVRRSLEWIRNCEVAIGYGDFGRVKDNYHNIKNIYGLLPEGFRKYSYDKIEKIRISLDKNEIANLIKEYESSKGSGKTTLTNSLYKKIQGKYKKLPKKYQEKVYRRLFSGVNVF